MITVQIDDMRAAGKPGYVAKIMGADKQFLHAKELSGYGASRQVLTFELVEDGIYEVCDANFGSRKRNIYFLKIEDGQELARAETLHELLSDDEDLPELEGSQKQIDWAESIRGKFVSKCKLLNKEVPQWAANTNAKFWIDNRTKLG